MEYIELKDACFSLDKEIIEKTKLIENGKYEVINSARGIYGYYDKYNNLGDAIVVASRGEYAGFTNYMQKPFFAGALCYPYRSKIKELKTKFLYYFLKSKEEYIMKNIVVRGSIPALNKVDFDKIKIPMPPLKLQEDIIEKLDKFTEYINLLNEELILRQKQFRYYLDKLLDFSFEIPRINIKEVCDVRDGTHDSPKKTNDGKLLITSKNITKGYLDLSEAYYISKNDYEKINLRSKVDKGDILISMIGTIGEIIYVKDEPNYAIKNIGLIKASEKVNGKFLYYYLKTSYIKNKFLNSVKKGTQTFLTLSILRSLEIPLPPLEKQREIVNILDKFEALCSDTLPKEIALREKQYEYYRDKLFNF